MRRCARRSGGRVTSAVAPRARRMLQGRSSWRVIGLSLRVATSIGFTTPEVGRIQEITIGYRRNPTSPLGMGGLESFFWNPTSPFGGRFPSPPPSPPLPRARLPSPRRPVLRWVRVKTAQEGPKSRPRSLKIGLGDSRWHLTCLREAPRSPQDVPKRPRSSPNDAFERPKEAKILKKLMGKYYF